MAKIRFIINAVLWRDKVNGNTYHSARITRTRDGAVLYSQLQYGYGEQYKDTALIAMKNAGWLPRKYRAPNAYHLFERENKYPILWQCTKGTKRECLENGKVN